MSDVHGSLVRDERERRRDRETERQRDRETERDDGASPNGFEPEEDDPQGDDESKWR